MRRCLLCREVNSLPEAYRVCLACVLDESVPAALIHSAACNARPDAPGQAAEPGDEGEGE